MVVHLIRHAKPAIAGVLLGQLDPPLEPGDIPPSSIAAATVFTSPLQRARQTAVKMFPRHSAIVLPDLAEIGMGEWEGKSWREIETTWPELATAKLAGWTTVTPPGGETWKKLEARAGRAWKTICQAEPPVAVVAHVGINGLLYFAATGAPAAEFTQDYCEVITLDGVPHHPNRKR